MLKDLIFRDWRDFFVGLYDDLLYQNSTRIVENLFDKKPSCR